MSKLKVIIITIFIFFIIPLGVKADCASDFKKVEKDFSVKYKYNEDTDDFTITLVCPDRNKYTFGFFNQDDAKDAYWTNDGNKKITTIRNYKNSEYRYLLIGTYGECIDYIAKEGTLTLNKDNSTTDEETPKEILEVNKSNKTSKYFKENTTESIIILLSFIGILTIIIFYILKSKKNKSR